MKKRKNVTAGEAEVNMTPMLDIVFIMLIFFIVTSTFVRESGLDVTEHRNDEEQKNNKKAKAIIVQICANEEIYVDRRAVDVRSIRANVERKLAEDAGAVVIIETEREAPTGALVMVMDQAIEARAAVSVAPTEARCRVST
jgi:biopolymer transport protein ExbD